MAAFDAVAYKADVIVPVARNQSRALQQALAEMKDSAAKRPASFDLAFLYQIGPGMADADIASRLNAVKVCWNNEAVKSRDPKRKAAAAFVRQLHDLLEGRNPDFTTQKWWAESIAQKQRAKLGVITQLAEILKTSPYAGLKCITADRLASVAANDAAFSSLDGNDLAAAAEGAGLTVVEPVDIPTDPGIANYSALIAKLNEATDPTIVHAVFFDDVPASYSILGRGEDGRPFLLDADARRLDATTTAAARDANNKGYGPEVTARGKVLDALANAAAKGVDLDALVVYHLADEAKQRSQGGLLQIAYQYLLSIGLEGTDAARIVLSLDTAAEAKNVVTADEVRALLADGALREAETALVKFQSKAADEAKAEVEQLRTALNDQRTKVEQLRAAAAVATGNNDIPGARAKLLEAVRLDRENEGLARDLASLPPESPTNVAAVVQPADDPALIQVRVSWQAGLGSDDSTRYRVVRKLGAAPKNVDDGTLIGETTTVSVVDEHPALIDEAHYAVFATRGKAYSLPSAASNTVVPGVGRLTLSTTPTGVAGHWVNPANASEITVVQTGPDGVRSKIPLSSPASFVSDGLTQGARYRYEVTAHYRSRTGAAVASEPAVKDAIPRTEAQPVRFLTVKPMVTKDSVCRIEAQWSRQPAHEVQLWCFPQPPVWSYGTRLSVDALSGNGRQLQGHGADKSAVSTLVAEVPSGLMHYAAVTIDGDDRIIGQVDQLGICEPVGNPRVERFGEEAVLSWDWPAADYSVRAVWSGPSTSGEATISKTRYESAGGMRIRVGSGRSEIRLATFIDHADGQWQSPIRTVTVEAPSATVRYQIAWCKKLFGGASGFDVIITADGEVSRGDLVIGYRADRVMPSSMKRIEEIQRHSLQLGAGESVTYQVSLPKMAKPYWVRCFLDGAEGSRIVDPPTDDLRGR